MCGIYGELRLAGQHSVGASIAQAVGAQAHRGPDEQGLWHNDQVALAMCRLSIIDLAGGQQPIWNEDHSCCIVYNGELYNFADLRPLLQASGHRFRTRSDTEVVLHAYEQWGPACLQRFNGMFAFAIYDARQHSLFLARDRIGEKPLYYHRDAERLLFASEIKALLADPSVPRQLHLPGLANFLAFGHAVAPETIYQGIAKLLPGHYLLVRHGQLQVVQYWDVGDEPALPAGVELSEAEYAERILALLEDSVRRRMIADVPVGAFLSGGVDSSAIVALMRQHTSAPVQTFSLGFSIGGAYNELSDARRVAEQLGTEHHELQVDHVDLVATLRKLVYHYDEPFGDPAGFPVYLLSQFARQHVKVVLTGDGGDELFGGYRRYAIDQVAWFYQYAPNLITRAWIPRLVDYVPQLRRGNYIAQLLSISDPVSRYIAWQVFFSPELQAELLCPEVLGALQAHDPAWPYPHYYHRLNGATANDHLNRLMYVDLKTLLADGYLEKTDKASMACSLEARLPLLDHRLVELAFQIPSRYKIRGWSTKRIFKRALGSLLPAAVLNKPKHGFAVPTDPWFRGELKDFTFDILLDQRTRRRGYFNTQVVERLWREHLAGRHRWKDQLWLLLNFELWHRIYLDGDGI